MNKITLLLIPIAVVLMTGCAFPHGPIGWAKQTKVTPEVGEAKDKAERNISDRPWSEPRGFQYRGNDRRP